MLKKLILLLLVVFASIELALARIDPIFVRTYWYGLTAVECMALITAAFAILDNLGRAYDKKRQDPDFKYNYAYANVTLIAIGMTVLGVLGMDVVELNINTVVMAIIIGLGGNETFTTVAKATKKV